MQDRQTLFVIGAGASCELGLPSGRSLLKEISSSVRVSQTRHEKKIDVDDVVLKAFHRLMHEEGLPSTHESERVYRECAEWLAANAPLAPSIDNLLHTHQNDERLVRVGKVLIAHCLLKAERESCMYRDPSTNDTSRFLYSEKIVVSDNGNKSVLSAQRSWLGRLFWLLAEESSYKDFLEKLEKTTFVSFNYDRCIEHFLSHAATSYFKLTSDQMKEVLLSIHILHPYGSLGKLQVSGEFALGFGNKDSTFESSKGIRTFTEGIIEDRMSTLICHAFSTASEVYFLGFGFLEQNLNLLIKDSNPLAVDRIIGTCSGLSSDSTEILEKYIRKTMYENYTKMNPVNAETHACSTLVKLHDLVCSEFMDYFHFHMRKLG